MNAYDPQVPWTEEQWARVTQTIQEEANRARVAAKFLPMFGPLPGDTDFVKTGLLDYHDAPHGLGQSKVMHVHDKGIIQLTTIQVRVVLRGAQMADPDLTSALQMFRRAANVVARVEDAIVFCGQTGMDNGPLADATASLPKIWSVSGGENNFGLRHTAHSDPVDPHPHRGAALVQQVSRRIGELEGRGFFGPFAVVLGDHLFNDAQSPANSLVLPADRIVPFLGGGPLVRSSTLASDEGMVIALGAEVAELVVATDISLSFLQVTVDPHYVFRVYEKIAVRLKEKHAIEMLSRSPVDDPEVE